MHVSETHWTGRITPLVQRWWRRVGRRIADPSICEDLAQAAWVSILEGRIREEHWAADLWGVIRDAASLSLRGVNRGATLAPWPWAAREVRGALRDRRLPIEQQVHLRIALERTYHALSNPERLVLYGLCCVHGPAGPGSAGIPQAWAQQWGMSRIMVHLRLQRIRRILAVALGSPPAAARD